MVSRPRRFDSGIRIVSSSYSTRKDGLGRGAWRRVVEVKEYLLFSTAMALRVRYPMNRRLITVQRTPNTRAINVSEDTIKIVS
jgi:hypothetical protein